MQRFIDKRTEWNRPIWCGEMGEPQTLDWPERAVTLLESNGIGWTYWPWKKMNTNNDPYSIDVPTDWNSFVGIVANPGSQPDAGTLQDVLDDYLARIPVDRCQYNVLAAGCTYVGQICEGVPSVLVDNRGGAKQRVDHLLSVHHFRRFTDLVVIRNPKNAWTVPGNDSQLMAWRGPLRQCCTATSRRNSA